MGLIKVQCFLMLISARGLLALRCMWNQTILINPDSSRTCLDCPVCPPGQGVYPYCGSVMTDPVDIKCVPCRTGVSFSTETNLASCTPCSRCGPNEKTLRKCSPTQNAICGKCNHGYYREFTGDCFRCTWCCPNATAAERSPECLKQGIPAHRACRDISEKYCGPPTPAPTTELPQVHALVVYTVPGWLVVVTCMVFIIFILVTMLFLLKFVMKKSLTHQWQRMSGDTRQQPGHFTNWQHTTDEDTEQQVPVTTALV